MKAAFVMLERKVLCIQALHFRTNETAQSINEWNLFCEYLDATADFLLNRVTYTEFGNTV